ncbi:MAG TPA: ChbG/HpnK family deacetylase [Candidatus Nitrosotalea sp.]|nr:ChbG/HpnK family deacetylase [Candidatus Nitrosotalea sp.]
MKYLIVNADDLGASRGINRAVAELYERGVLTSASLMIAMPASSEALRFAERAAKMSVGLHLALTDENAEPLVDFNDAKKCAAVIARQIDNFCDRMGRLPTHLDSHQNVHRDERLRSLFVAAATRHSLPLREHSPVRYFSAFYGQWDGEPHPEQIGIESLLLMLKTELDAEFTELSCHPGHSGSDFVSPYDKEREIELQTLSDPRFLEFLRDNSIRLTNFAEARSLWSDALSA